MRTRGSQGSDPAEHVRRLLGLNIRAVRDGQGRSREQLAESIRGLGLAVTADAVRQWETGVASPRWLMSVAIAQVLGVTWSDIFNLDEVTL